MLDFLFLLKKLRYKVLPNSYRCLKRFSTTHFVARPVACISFKKKKDRWRVSNNWHIFMQLWIHKQNLSRKGIQIDVHIFHGTVCFATHHIEVPSHDNWQPYQLSAMMAIPDITSLCVSTSSSCAQHDDRRFEVSIRWPHPIESYQYLHIFIAGDIGKYS